MSKFRQFRKFECIEDIRCNFECPASERLGRRKTELLKSNMEHFRTGKLRQTSPQVRFLSTIEIRYDSTFEHGWGPALEHAF
jgi:hypothetical protein